MALTLEFKQLLFEVHYILFSLFGDMPEFFLGKLFSKGKKNLGHERLSSQYSGDWGRRIPKEHGILWANKVWQEEKNKYKDQDIT